MQFLTPKQAAQILGVSVQIIRNLMASGAIPYIDAGPRCRRIAAADLMRMAQTKEPKK